MEFIAKHYGDKIQVVNPHGDVGVCTLWSLVENSLGVLKKAGISLNPADSRVAVVANLYGNGLPQMLRNLLYNPQIRYLVVMGKDLEKSKEKLVNFFELGLEEIIFLGAKAFRIRCTEGIIDGLLRPEDFPHKPIFRVFGDIGDAETSKGLQIFFDQLPERDIAWEVRELKRVEPPPIPEPEVTRFPSDPLGHNIIRDTPMEAWRELIFRLYRFGHRNTVAKSRGKEERVELLNVKVVIRKPSEESENVLKEHGFSLEKFEDYQRSILASEKPADIDYTYGNRLRGYFYHYNNQKEKNPDALPLDMLLVCANRLKKDPESRHAYVSLWDSTRDLPEGKSTPCFVSAFFRKFEGKLFFTATFRVHNAFTAWPENVYGLIAIQREVCHLSGLEPGPITVISHSISIDPSGLEKAKKIAELRESDDEVDLESGKISLRMDSNGNFNVTVDWETSEIVLEHRFNGMKIGEYRGKSSEEIERGLARDCSVSEISHALYIGREVAKAEAQLRTIRK